MVETLFADGLASGASNKLAEYAIKVLAVGGGFLVGYATGGLAAWALNRWVFAHKAPEQLKRVCALLGGLALAIVVALILFGSGGGGLFGSGGGPNGSDAVPNDKGKEPPTVTPKEEPKLVPPKVEPKPPEARPTPGDVRVAILGGADVSDGKFYLIDAVPGPKTLDELKRAIADRPKGKDEIVLVFRFAKEPLSDTHPEMKRLSAWVKDAKLTSRFE